MGARVRMEQGLSHYLGEFGPTVAQSWRTTLCGRDVETVVTAGGFGNPYLLVTCGGGRPRIELALVESENYTQDGRQPVQCDGWRWRERRAGDLLTGGWSDLYDTAEAALEAGMAEVTD